MSFIIYFLTPNQQSTNLHIEYRTASQFTDQGLKNVSAFNPLFNINSIPTIVYQQIRHLYSQLQPCQSLYFIYNQNNIHQYIVYQNIRGMDLRNLTPYTPIYISTNYFALGLCLPTITDPRNLFKIIKGKIYNHANQPITQLPPESPLHRLYHLLKSHTLLDNLYLFVEINSIIIYQIQGKLLQPCAFMYTDGSSGIEFYQRKTKTNIKLPTPIITSTQDRATTPTHNNDNHKQRPTLSSTQEETYDMNSSQPTTQRPQKNKVSLASFLMGLFTNSQEKLPQPGDPAYDEIKHLYPKEWRF